MNGEMTAAYPQHTQVATTAAYPQHTQVLAVSHTQVDRCGQVNAYAHQDAPASHQMLDLMLKLMLKLWVKYSL